MTASGDVTADLVTWLGQQFDEVERVALAAATRAGGQRWVTTDGGDVTVADADGSGYLATGPWESELREVGLHIARWDPARVLAEVAAKRAILRDLEERKQEILRYGVGKDSLSETHDAGVHTGLRRAARALAQPYAGRPGWRPEWAAEVTA